MKGGGKTVYFTDKIELYGEELFNDITPYVSPERLQYASRYRLASDRLQSVLAYALLRFSLYKEYGLAAFPAIGKGENGKPFLINNPEIGFNVSHCKKGVACAVSSGKIGVDIQDFAEYSASVADMFMSAEERARALNGGGAEEFTRIWTLKESYGKYVGVGVCYDMRNKTIRENVFDEAAISKSYLYDDFVVSVTAGEIVEPEKVSVGELLEALRRVDGNISGRSPLKY